MKPRLPTLSGDRGAWKSRSCAGRDMLVMKISAPSKGADLPGSITRATRGSGSQNLSTTCKGSSSSTGSHLSSSNLATLARGSAAKTQQSRAEGKSYRQLLLATP